MRQDSERLAQLRRSLILSSERQHALDEITQMLATSLEVPVVFINFMDKDRDCFESVVGLVQHESSAATSMCEIFFRSTSDIIVTNDASLDDRFSSHPFVVGEPYVRFYGAARISLRGHTLGTLCAYDVQPRNITVAQIETLQTLATAVMELLDKRDADAHPPARRSLADAKGSVLTSR